jgi:hypothetical protein
MIATPIRLCCCAREETDGYAVSLQRPDTIKAGEPVSLVYRFTEDGAPVTDLRPYLEAPLHLAVVKKDLSQFQHEHGTVPGEEHAGRSAHASGHDDHASHTHEGPSAFGPEVTATLSFPESGTYHLFGQAAHGDRLLITRSPSRSAKPTAATRRQARLPARAALSK